MSRNSNEIDHGCGFGFLEGTLALISKKGNCSHPTEYEFWKDPEDVAVGVKTRNQIKKSPIASQNYMENYFEYKRDLIQKSNLTTE